MKFAQIKKTAQQGFTLIELMIVVAIIGILAAIAIPQYQDYMIRARLVKVNAAMSSVKAAMAEYFQFNGGVITNIRAGANGVAGANSGWTEPMISGGLGLAAFPNLINETSSITMAAGTGIVTVTLQRVGACADTNTITWAPQAGTTVMSWALGGTILSGAASVCRSEISKW